MTPPPEPTGGRRLPLIGAAVAALLLLLAWLAVAKSLRDLGSSQEREQKLEARIADTDRKIESLRNRIVRLHNDPGLLERLAREELGFVRPKDVIIELPMPVSALASTSPAGATGSSAPAGPLIDPLAPLVEPAVVPATPQPPTQRPGRHPDHPAPIVLPPSDAPPTPE